MTESDAARERVMRSLNELAAAGRRAADASRELAETVNRLTAETEA